MLTDAEKELKQLAEQATAGDWQVRQSPMHPDNPDQCIIQCRVPGKAYGQEILADDYFKELSRRADIDYVAAAQPSVILALLKKIEESTNGK